MPSLVSRASGVDIVADANASFAPTRVKGKYSRRRWGGEALVIRVVDSDLEGREGRVDRAVDRQGN